MKKHYINYLLFASFIFLFTVVSGSETGNDVKIGTNSNSATFPQVVFCSQQNKFLTVWKGNENGFDRIYYNFQTEAGVSGTPSPNGNVLSSAPSGTFRYSERPRVAYDASTGTAAVVWLESYAPGKDSVMLSIIDVAAETEVAEILVAANNTWNMSASVGSDNAGNFLVAFYDTTSLTVTAKVYDLNGVQSGSDMTLGTVPGGYLFPYSIDIAYNTVDNHFLVVWADYASNLFSRTVKTDGTTGSLNDYASITGVVRPAIAFNNSTNQFLMVYDNFNGLVTAQITEGTGTLSGTSFNLGLDDIPEAQPDVVFNPEKQNFLVAWSALSGATQGIWVQEVFTGDCNHLQTAVKIDDVTLTAQAPSITYGNNDDNYWITWFGASQNRDEIFLQRYKSDFEPVKAVCQDITVYLGANGEYILTPDEIDNGSSAVCENPSLSLINNRVTCSDMPQTTIGLIATNSSGVSDTCYASVTVLDALDPMAVCRDADLYIDENGSALLDASMVDNGSNDNCGVETLELDKTAFSCTDTGLQVVTLSVEDESGNTATCTADVTVRDTISPQAFCQNITVYLDENGKASIDSSMIDNGSVDNCDISTMVLSDSLFYCSDAGSREISLTVTDVNGNQSLCSAQVTVVDTLSPRLTCPGDQTVSRGANCQFIIPDYSTMANATDNCGNPVVTQLPEPGTVVETGTTLITLTASDGVNSSECTFNLIVEGPRVDFSADHPVSCFESEISFTDLSADAISWHWDFGDGTTVENIQNPTHVYQNPGSYSVKLKVTDAFGCTDSITKISYITVQPPKAAFTANPSLGCTLPHPVFFTDNSTSPDTWHWDFGDGSFSSAQNPIHNYTTYGTFQVVLTVTDTILGCSDTATAVIEVLDDEPPSIACPEDTFLFADETCQGTLPDYTSLARVSDLCDPNPLVTQSPLPGTLFSDSAEVILTATDAQNNQNSCSFWVKLKDTILPEAICQPVTVFLDANGTGTLVASQIDNGSADACGIDWLAIDKTEFDCSDVGVNTVTLTVADVNGNTSVCSADVTVTDKTPPEISCNPMEVYLGSNGEYVLSRRDIRQMAEGTTDACTSFEAIDVYAFPRSFECIHVGQDVPVTLFAIDEYGNRSSCQTTVTVLDTITPRAICEDITLTLDENGKAFIFPGDINAGRNDGSRPEWARTYSGLNEGSYDACGIETVSLDKQQFSCSDIGQNAVTLTVTDPSGNFSSCTSLVTVEDAASPEIEAVSDIEIEVDPGVCETTIEYPELVISDNCNAELILVSGLGPDGLFPPGSTTETWVAIDASGNTSSEISFVVTVNTSNAPPELDEIPHLEIPEDTGSVAVELTGISYGNDCVEETVNVSAQVTQGNGFVMVDSVMYTADSGSGKLILSILPDSNGEALVEVTVTDAGGKHITRDFGVTVTPVNDPPFLVNPIADQVIHASYVMKIPVSNEPGMYFDDIDGDMLALSVMTESGDSLPEWIEIKEDTIFARPLIADTGCENLVVEASDGQAVSKDTFQVCVDGYPTATELPEADRVEVLLFPNPTRGKVKVNIGTTADDIMLTVLDINGRKVFQKEYTASRRIEFDMSESASGIYFVRIEFNNEQVLKKLVLDKK